MRRLLHALRQPMPTGGLAYLTCVAFWIYAASILALLLGGGHA
jgi:hypothetical protein